MPRHPPYALSSLTIKKSFFLRDFGFTLYFADTGSVPARQTLFLVCACFRSSYAIVKELKLCVELVEVNGFEPMASCVQGRRSPN